MYFFINISFYRGLSGSLGLANHHSLVRSRKDGPSATSRTTHEMTHHHYYGNCDTTLQISRLPGKSLITSALSHDCDSPKHRRARIGGAFGYQRKSCSLFRQINPFRMPRLARGDAIHLVD
jgi:hypothetical protein